MFFLRISLLVLGSHRSFCFSRWSLVLGEACVQGDVVYVWFKDVENRDESHDDAVYLVSSLYVLSHFGVM